MLDIVALDTAIKLKAWGRFGKSKHPFFIALKE